MTMQTIDQDEHDDAASDPGASPPEPGAVSSPEDRPPSRRGAAADLCDLRRVFDDGVTIACGAKRSAKTHAKAHRKAQARIRYHERKIGAPAQAMPGPGDVPAELRAPRTRGRQPKPADREPGAPPPLKREQRELRASIFRYLQMGNGIIVRMVPCTCPPGRPEGLPDDLHAFTCAKTKPLRQEEVETLADAIAQEFEAHPNWQDGMERFRSWTPHVNMAIVIITIMLARIIPPPGALMVAEPEGPVDAMPRAPEPAPDLDPGDASGDVQPFRHFSLSARPGDAARIPPATSL